jgi:hypothetical protein
MIKIIETNLSIHNETGEVMDHQSRIIEAESWDKYVDYYFNYIDGFTEMKEFKCLTSLQGRTLPLNAEIKDFKYDEIHLSCNVIKHIDYHDEYLSIITKKLAYRVFENEYPKTS